MSYNSSIRTHKGGVLMSNKKSGIERKVKAGTDAVTDTYYKVKKAVVQRFDETQVKNKTSLEKLQDLGLVDENGKTQYKKRLQEIFSDARKVPEVAKEAFHDLADKVIAYDNKKKGKDPQKKEQSLDSIEPDHIIEKHVKRILSRVHH